MPAIVLSGSFGGMDMLAQIEAAARGGAMTLLVLWTLVILRRNRTQPAAQAVALLCLSVICHLVAIMPDTSTGVVAIDLLIEVGSGTVPAIFWLVARLWFDDEDRLARGPVLVVAAATSLPALSVLSYHTGWPPMIVVGPLWRLTSFGFAAAGLWIAWRGRRDDLVESRRRLRVALVWSVGLYVALVNGAEIAIFQFGAPYVLRSMLVIGILVLTFGLAAATLGLHDADLFGPSRPRRVPDEARGDDPEAAMLAARLATLMADERLYRTETLAIAALAARLGVPEYRLRRLINRHLGHRNFAAYLNGLRLEEVRAALADPAQREVPILTIALDSGFGSLAPFNRAFREAEGMTPTEYRQSALAVG